MRNVDKMMRFLPIAHAESKKISGKNFFEYMRTDYRTLSALVSKHGGQIIDEAEQCIKENRWEESLLIMGCEDITFERFERLTNNK